MKYPFASVLPMCFFALFGNLAFAQQDCFNAITVCTDSYSQSSSYSGVGSVLEVAPGTSCLGNGETNSVWYTFNVSASGTLEFQLNPINPNDDYDFALYDLTNDSCSGILAGLNTPVSCNYSADQGATGLSPSGNGNDNGSSGSNQNAPVNVQSGEQYALLVSNFTASQTGYTLDFSGSASIADDQPALPDSISLKNRCNPIQVFLFFSEGFDCSSVSSNGSEITVTGPEAVVVNSVNPVGCSGGRTDQIRVRFANKIMTTGTYTITINSGTDGNTFLDQCGNETPTGTTFTFDVNLIGPNVNVINVTHSSCGQANGSAEAVGSLGTPPYTYWWNTSPTQNTAVATGMEPGSYTVRVTDSNGCQEYKGVNIQNDSPIDLSNYSSTGVSCHGASDGSAQITPAGGSGPYTVEWQTNPIQTGNSATNLPGGNVNVAVTDNSGCQETTTINVPQPPSISIPISSVNPDCGMSNGSATVNASGGNGGFTYAWNTNPVQATATANGLSAAVYTITVTDQNGCTASSNVILTNNFAPNATIENRIPDCGQGVGQATAVATSGTAPYSFSWNTVPPQLTATATNLIQGDYYTTITDANGCVQIINVKIDSVPPPQLSTTVSQPTCGMSDGEITASVTNGISPFTYTWSSSSNTSNIETGLAEGTYTVNVTDSIGCTDSVSVDLMQLPPTSEFQADGVCLGEESDFQSQSNANATSWYWDFGDGTTSTLENPTHVYAAAGDYNVTVYFLGGCEDDTVTQTVSVFAPPTTDFSIQPDIITTRTDAQFTYTGTGGTNFVWDFGDSETSTLSNPTHQYGQEGFYTINLTATDPHGCSDTASIRIEVLLQPVIYFPNAFMPEGRYENKVFKGYGLGIVTAELWIYNRWGALVYQATNSRDVLFNGWDGNYAGKQAPPGVYAYKIKARFYDDSEFEKLGTVTLIR
ncbi:MAG: PKD domain-containing protein [Flavobacteriales bacterium]|nr:PKD domain-containing protein [Flavobacteriales bacterium]